MSKHEAGMVLRAAEALRSGQENFSASQVAFLLDLAYHSGYGAGFREGVDATQADMFEGLKRALGGPEVTTMQDAVAVHLRLVDQKNARETWVKQAAEERPHGLRLDDPDWPPVAVPGVGAHFHTNNQRDQRAA